eukprot:7556637-Pyramimonas_sp.AAC.2
MKGLACASRSRPGIFARRTNRTQGARSQKRSKRGSDQQHRVDHAAEYSALRRQRTGIGRPTH